MTTRPTSVMSETSSNHAVGQSVESKDTTAANNPVSPPPSNRLVETPTIPRLLNQLRALKFEQWQMVVLIASVLIHGMLYSMTNFSSGYSNTISNNAAVSPASSQEFISLATEIAGSTTHSSHNNNNAPPRFTNDIFRVSTSRRSSFSGYHNASMLQFISLLGHNVYYSECEDNACINNKNKTLMTEKYNEFSDDFIPTTLNITRLTADITLDGQQFFGDPDLPISFVCSHHLGQVINFVIVRAHKKYGTHHIATLPKVAFIYEDQTYEFYVLFDAEIAPPSNPLYSYLENNSGDSTYDIVTNVYSYQPNSLRTEQFMREYINNPMTTTLNTNQRIVYVYHRPIFTDTPKRRAALETFTLDAKVAGAIGFCHLWTHQGGTSISKYELPSIRFQSKRTRNEQHSARVKATQEQIRHQQQEAEERALLGANSEGKVNLKLDLSNLSGDEKKFLELLLKDKNRKQD